jgi:hypothetical protein
MTFSGETWKMHVVDRYMRYKQPLFSHILNYQLRWSASTIKMPNSLYNTLELTQSSFFFLNICVEKYSHLRVGNIALFNCDEAQHFHKKQFKQAREDGRMHGYR